MFKSNNSVMKFPFVYDDRKILFLKGNIICAIISNMLRKKII